MSEGRSMSRLEATATPTHVNLTISEISTWLAIATQTQPDHALVWLPSWYRGRAVEVRTAEHLTTLTAGLSGSDFAGFESAEPGNRRWAQVASHDPDGRHRRGFIVELSDGETQVVVGNPTGLNADDLEEVTGTGLRVGIVKSRYFISETHWRPIQVADIAYDWVANGDLPTPPAHYTRVVWRSSD